MIYSTSFDVIGYPFILNAGDNNIKIADVPTEAARTLERQLTINAEYHTCRNVYLRWLDDYGLYRYWMFDKYYEEEYKTKELGEIVNQFNSLDEADSVTNSIGVSLEQTRRIKAAKLSIEHYQYLISIIQSPCIYLFTGEWGYPGLDKYWIKVKLDKGNTRRGTKRDFSDIDLTIKLPEYYTVKL